MQQYVANSIVFSYCLDTFFANTRTIISDNLTSPN